MEEWIKCPLGDILNFRRGHDLPKTSMVPGDIPVAGSNGIIGFHNVSTPISPCITIGRSGNVGTPYIYDICWAHNTVLYIDDYKGNDPKYLYYLLKTLPLASFGGGSAVPTLNRNHIHPMEVIFCKDTELQKKIAGILSKIDDKIELNRQINDNLEQQAQNIFNHYFIESQTELGPYSEGFLTDIAVYLNGLAMQKFRPEGSDSGLPVLKIKELGQRSCDNNSDRCSSVIKDEYIVNDGDVIFSWSGTLLVDIWCGGKCGLNQHLFKVTSDSYPTWFYYFWTKHHLDNFIRVAKDKAVTMGHIKRTELEKANVIIPSKEKLSEIDKILSPIIDGIITHRVEMRRLVQLRDSLLPELMSGELKINEIDS